MAELAAANTAPAALNTERYTLHSQGAEAVSGRWRRSATAFLDSFPSIFMTLQRVWEGRFLGRDVIVKERFAKQYRHPALDAKLTGQRLRQEARAMLRARKLGVPAPVLYSVDTATASLYMERVPGHSLKTLLHGGTVPLPEQLELVREMGRLVAGLHDGAMVHGDLTTSNVLVVEEPRRHLVVIDFGLSYFSKIAEDKAVDLYVLERAFTSAHAAHGVELFEACLEAYKSASRMWSSTLNKFAEVRLRGRKRSMVG